MGLGEAGIERPGQPMLVGGKQLMAGGGAGRALRSPPSPARCDPTIGQRGVKSMRGDAVRGCGAERCAPRYRCGRHGGERHRSPAQTVLGREMRPWGSGGAFWGRVGCWEPFAFPPHASRSPPPRGEGLRRSRQSGSGSARYKQQKKELFLAARGAVSTARSVPVCRQPRRRSAAPGTALQGESIAAPLGPRPRAEGLKGGRGVWEE